MTEQKKPWFVGERAEALAGLFLLDMNPDYLGKPVAGHAPYDFLVTFTRTDKSLITVAVEVKGTERPLINPHRLLLPRGQVQAMENSNTPFLIVVVDVKRNDIGFNWASCLKIKDGRVKMVSHSRYDLPIRKNAPEEIRKLKHEIFGEQSPALFRETRGGSREGEA